LPGNVRLDEAVAAHAGVTRSRARSLIMAGRVRVDGTPVTKPGAAVRESAALDIERPRPYVSRGGEKLEAALSAFGIDPSGARALDVGASTGGFTDCLLKAGAGHVTALDVGYGQLAYELRTDPRVAVVERCNFRLVPDDAFGREFDLVTIDASFISVVTLVDRALRFLKDGGDVVALIKPQFEAGRDRLGGGGVVRDPEVHRAVLRETMAGVTAAGAAAVALCRSPLRGPAGNVEFFARIRRDDAAVGEAAIESVLAE
jgi:23S rRNA (cytidine1920-2'-O)/16S rRNA (cytidine1409-2'-O)-methyltransferase